MVIPGLRPLICYVYYYRGCYLYHSPKIGTVYANREVGDVNREVGDVNIKVRLYTPYLAIYIIIT